MESYPTNMVMEKRPCPSRGVEVPSTKETSVNVEERIEVPSKKSEQINEPLASSSPENKSNTPVTDCSSHFQTTAQNPGMSTIHDASTNVIHRYDLPKNCSIISCARSASDGTKGHGAVLKNEENCDRSVLECTFKPNSSENRSQELTSNSSSEPSSTSLKTSSKSNECVVVDRECSRKIRGIASCKDVNQTFIDRKEGKHKSGEVGSSSSNNYSHKPAPDDASRIVKVDSKESRLIPSKCENLDSLDATAPSENLEGNWKSPLTQRPPFVDMSETVASFVLDSGTTYSYKKVLREESSIRNTHRVNEYLVIRENMFDDPAFDPCAKLPLHIVELLEMMKKRFEDFYSKMEDLKEKFSNVHSSHSGKNEDKHYSPQSVNDIFALVDEVKEFPALVELEMVIFAEKCKQHYSKISQEIVDRNKKVRWCSFCLEPAVFHCCFKASYCSVKCQKQHWSQHSVSCGQQHHSLLDPHLRMNKILSQRVLLLNKEEITISRLEELSKSTFKESNKDQLCKPPSKPNASALTDNSEWGLDNKRKRSFTFMKNKNLKNLIRKTYVRNPKQAELKSRQTISQQRLNRSSEENSFELVELKPSTEDLKEKVACKPDLGNTDENLMLFSKEQLDGEEAHEVKMRSNLLPKVSTAGLQNGKAYTPSLSAINVKPNNNDAGKPGTSVVFVPRPTPVSPNRLQFNSSLRFSPPPQKLMLVTLPTGGTKLVPVGDTNCSPPPVKKMYNNSYGVRLGAPHAVNPSSSIVIRPDGRAPQNAFLPLSQLVNTQSTSSVSGLSGQPRSSYSSSHFLPTSSKISFPPLSQPVRTYTSTCLPSLTPIVPKTDSSFVRTLNDEELDKILSTDHLLDAFDSSYHANTCLWP